MTLIETLRGPRFMGMAIFDWAFSLLGAWLVGRWLGVHDRQWIVFLLAWVLMGVLAHYLAGVDSAFSRMLDIHV